jgi:predicted NAD-dependent protein-ADP-ribosyltransferase YbiA (DUF1768 family)
MITWHQLTFPPINLWSFPRNNEMDIRSGCGYPAASLSNFSPHPFIFDGMEVNSMEGLLQAFKFDKKHIQVEVCKLVGGKAKARGKPRNTAWQSRQVLWWNEVEYKRKGKEYQELLDRAYQAMCDQSESFRKALLATQNAVLTHSIGHNKEAETVLTEREFCSRLMALKKHLQDKSNPILGF